MIVRNNSTAEKVDLTGKWKFRAISSSVKQIQSKSKIIKWMNAAVPGTVHTDLMTQKIIPDPYIGMNELDVQWVDTVRWEYAREFRVHRSLLKRGRVMLVAEGLDTYATVYVNNRKVAETQNMFLEHRLDVKNILKRGKNTIRIVFDSPELRARELEKQNGTLVVAVEPHRVYTRKAQYSFGWDWGPKLTTSGIWREIYLEAFDTARIRNPFVRTVSITPEEAILDVSADIERTNDKPLKLYVKIATKERIIETTVPADNSTARVRMTIKEPLLWWPNGYGKQNIYTAELSLFTGTNEGVDFSTVSFGIRTVRLLCDEDKNGETFIIDINGVKIFCKGANWIPADNFIPRIPSSRYESLLRSATDAHMNMVRVWGGGIYEQDIFYELCDRLGLMVWQDFMFACGEYPEYDWFIRSVSEEAEQNIKRLRNHPSLVLWCGNNECEYLFCNKHPGKSPDDMRGAFIFRDELARLCAEFDGTRPYWRSSPFGSGHPNDESNGNHHQWDVWSNWKDYRHYESVRPRFVTEFGFQAPANRITYEEITGPEERDMQSKVMEHHNKQIEGTERLFRFQAGHYKVTSDFDTFIYQGQLLQAEALKFAVEHWRRQKFHTAGSIFWQLDDCWPVSSWSVIDSALRPKAAYFYAKRFFAPVLISLKRSHDGVDVWVTNDLLADVGGRIEVYLMSWNGDRKKFTSMTFMCAANTSAKTAVISRKRLGSIDISAHYLLARFTRPGEILSENRYILDEPKHLALPDAGIKTELKGSINEFLLTVVAKKFAKDVCIEFEGIPAVLSDNYFDLDAGQTKILDVRSQAGLRQLKKSLRVRHLR
jgi:beta-mannosidase